MGRRIREGKKRSVGKMERRVKKRVVARGEEKGKEGREKITRGGREVIIGEE